MHPLDIAAGAWWARACATLKTARGRASLTQRQLAAGVGTGQGTFWGHEHSTIVPKIGQAITWVEYLGHRLAVTRGSGDALELLPMSAWNRWAGQNLAKLRASCVVAHHIPAGRVEGGGHSQRTLAAALGKSLVTVQGVEAGRAVHVTTWAAYVFGIGWAPVLLAPSGAPACHTR